MSLNVFLHNFKDTSSALSVSSFLKPFLCFLCLIKGSCLTSGWGSSKLLFHLHRSNAKEYVEYFSLLPTLTCSLSKIQTMSVFVPLLNETCCNKLYTYKKLSLAVAWAWLSVWKWSIFYHRFTKVRWDARDYLARSSFSEKTQRIIYWFLCSLCLLILF